MSRDRLQKYLKEGTPVVVRPLVPSDRAGLAEGYRRLSPESRYQRFWARTGEVIGEAMLDRLLGDDLGNHAVWAVIDPERDFPGLGAASFWRSPEDSEEAEFSCTVLDGDQRRGIGTLLLAVLWVVAHRAGIRRFVGYTMPENVSAIRWMRDCGGHAEWDGYKVVFRWDLTDLDRIPATPAGVGLAGRLAEVSTDLLDG